MSMRHADGDLGNGVTSGGEIGQANLLCLSERAAWSGIPDVPGAILCWEVDPRGEPQCTAAFTPEPDTPIEACTDFFHLGHKGPITGFFCNTSRNAKLVLNAVGTCMTRRYSDKTNFDINIRIVGSSPVGVDIVFKPRDRLTRSYKSVSDTHVCGLPYTNLKVEPGCTSKIKNMNFELHLSLLFCGRAAIKLRPYAPPGSWLPLSEKGPLSTKGG
ncbi:uncharacterized protein H6S33_003029 [Morchella sextelata]|uniref:uncharacterized protein n=1 Tax=Morchella sextelata TaxID=1174677 RepID=UPI001D050D77|nr:uncharacterized protein H6S33_003029 [Morchella sextelata]KAH0607041.1 hypothetical protein H6S33_003029 [Morchella sextelata]